MSVKIKKWLVASAMLIAMIGCSKKDAEAPIPAISLGKTSIEVEIGASVQVAITGGTGTYQIDKHPNAVKASVSDSKLTIMGVAEGIGEVVISSGDKTAAISVRVIPKPLPLSVDQAMVNLLVGEIKKLSLTGGRSAYELAGVNAELISVKIEGRHLIIEGLKAGETSFRVGAKDESLDIKVMIASHLAIDHSDVALIVGGKVTLGLTGGLGAYKIADVDANLISVEVQDHRLVIEAKKEGETKFKVSSKDETLEIHVEIVKPLSVDQGSVTLEEGKSVTLNLMGGLDAYKLIDVDDELVSASIDDHHLIIEAKKAGETSFKIASKDESIVVKLVISKAIPDLGGKIGVYHEDGSVLFKPRMFLKQKTSLYMIKDFNDPYAANIKVSFLPADVKVGDKLSGSAFTLSGNGFAPLLTDDEEIHPEIIVERVDPNSKACQIYIPSLKIRMVIERAKLT